MGGESPDLSDLAVYGVLNAIEGTELRRTRSPENTFLSFDHIFASLSYLCAFELLNPVLKSLFTRGRNNFSIENAFTFSFEFHLSN